jgi:predicted metal-dependent enzyme (double-stranded beta helix superfamily)
MHHPFPGEAELIATIDEAVGLGQPHAITGELSRSLSRLIAEQRVQLPAAVFEADESHYARRLLHQSDRHGYCVIAMTWAPGQGTPIHDHAGLWCVEGVWRGALEVTPYDLLEEFDGEARFRAQKTIHARCGSTGSLIPPFEYHTIRNADPSAIAVSVHVYSQAMNRCAVFEPSHGEWHRRRERMLQAVEA